MSEANITWITKNNKPFIEWMHYLHKHIAYLEGQNEKLLDAVVESTKELHNARAATDSNSHAYTCFTAQAKYNEYLIREAKESQ